ncbi:MAG TPA: hypothetical protein VMU99_02865 [Acidimicrobiales bacterium]|nr:hypothetical protein [Acidimicrobiales bacterium]
MTVGAVGAVGAAVNKTSHMKTSTVKHLVFRKNGSPILNGITINIANSAGSAHIGDVHIYVMEQILKQWGATTSLIIGNANIAELGVASGKEDVCTSPVANAVDLGLTAMGPNQTALAYSLLTPTSITSLSQLKGKTYADDFTSGNVDYPLWNAVAKEGKFPLSDMTLLTTGAETNSFTQVVAGRASAAWVDPGTVASAGPNFHSLASGAKVAPKYADSMMFARPAWIAANPAVAEAIDLAWLAAAKIFNTDEPLWAQYGVAYTSGTASLAKLLANYQVLKPSGGFATSESSFSRSAVAYNIVVSKSLGIITSLGERPLSQMVKTNPWLAAWTQFAAHRKTL